MHSGYSYEPSPGDLPRGGESLDDVATMLESGETLRLILAALALGVAIPVALQLFLTLRQLQRTVHRMDPSLRLLGEMAKAQTEAQSSATAPVSQLPGIVAALIPALVAAYQSVRDHAHPTETSPNQGRETVTAQSAGEEHQQ